MGGVVFSILTDSQPGEVDAGRGLRGAGTSSTSTTRFLDLPPGCEELAVLAALRPERQRWINSIIFAVADPDVFPATQERLDEFRTEMIPHHATALTELGHVVPELEEPADHIRRYLVEVATELAATDDVNELVAARDRTLRTELPWNAVAAAPELGVYQHEVCNDLVDVFTREDLLLGEEEQNDGPAGSDADDAQDDGDAEADERDTDDGSA